jgi:phosphotransferase system enzyme I (PtsI)
MAPPLAAPAAGRRTPGVAADAEVARFLAARDAVRADLQARADASTGTAQEVLRATALMAADPALAAGVTRLVEDGDELEAALWAAVDELAAQLASLGGYLAERVADLVDVRGRVLAHLRGVDPPGLPDPGHPHVLVVADLAPADTATLDPATVLAVVTSQGGPQSHTAILARALGIPAVVAVAGADDLATGTEAYVDGAAGAVRTDPGPAEREAVAAWTRAAARLTGFDGSAALADGAPVSLLANVGGDQDAATAAGLGARGVGLFRTEFCFLGHTSEPTAEEQTERYRAVLKPFQGGKVIVRTLDAGADKPLPFVTSAGETNPALGVRGYRTATPHPGVLTRQLAAIATAADGLDVEVGVMAPMVATPDEAAAFARACREAGVARAGVMIEVPAAALLAEEILDEVDFVSIGTNDLTQYTLAADRELAPLSSLNDPWQPAVLRLVDRVARAGAALRRTPDEKGVGVCGEAAADPALAVVLAGLGVTSLSMTARALPTVAAVLASVDTATARSLADVALTSRSASQARDRVRSALPVLAELGL